MRQGRFASIHANSARNGRIATTPLIRMFAMLALILQSNVQAADPAFLGAADFAAYLKGEMPRWAQAVAASGTRRD